MENSYIAAPDSFYREFRVPPIRDPRRISTNAQSKLPVKIPRRLGSMGVSENGESVLRPIMLGLWFGTWRIFAEICDPSLGNGGSDARTLVKSQWLQEQGEKTNHRYDSQSVRIFSLDAAGRENIGRCLKVPTQLKGCRCSILHRQRILSFTGQARLSFRGFGLRGWG